MVESFKADAIVIGANENGISFDVFPVEDEHSINAFSFSVGYLVDLLTLFAAEQSTVRVAGTPDPVDYSKPFIYVALTGTGKEAVGSLTLNEVTSLVETINTELEEFNQQRADSEELTVERPPPKSSRTVTRSQLSQAQKEVDDGKRGQSA